MDIKRITGIQRNVGSNLNEPVYLKPNQVVLSLETAKDAAGAMKDIADSKGWDLPWRVGAKQDNPAPLPS